MLQYQFIPKNKIVFDYHDKGELFYIIISGKADIVIPTLQVGEYIPSDYLSVVADGKYERNVTAENQLKSLALLKEKL